MPIDVDWPGTEANAHRIFIPRADMPIVQASPEIREFDLVQFHLDLRTLEAAQLGAPWPETHRHTAESVLSGITFARVVDIIPPYVVEFEDGQYGVRAVGANHNLLDVKVSNQVSLLVSLSAGLISQAELVEGQADLLAGQAALAAAQAALDAAVQEIRLIQGLELGSPMTANAVIGSRSAGSVSQTITHVGDDVIVTRNP